MSSFSDDTRKKGYSKEDEYFYKKDQELLERLKREAEARRDQAESENQRKEYWMRCPKCGSKLNEETYGDVIAVDRCSNAKCAGVFFDGGELELLLRAKGSLFKRIFGG
jgi:hypothetical protein